MSIAPVSSTVNNPAALLNLTNEQVVNSTVTFTGGTVNTVLTIPAANALVDFLTTRKASKAKNTFLFSVINNLGPSKTIQIAANLVGNSAINFNANTIIANGESAFFRLTQTVVKKGLNEVTYTKYTPLTYQNFTEKPALASKTLLTITSQTLTAAQVLNSSLVINTESPADIILTLPLASDIAKLTKKVVLNETYYFNIVNLMPNNVTLQKSLVDTNSTLETTIITAFSEKSFVLQFIEVAGKLKYNNLNVVPIVQPGVIPIQPSPTSLILSTNTTLTGLQTLNSNLSVRPLVSADTTITLPSASNLIASLNGPNAARIIEGQKFYVTVSNAMPSNVVTITNPTLSGNSIIGLTNPVPSQNSVTFEIELMTITTPSVKYTVISPNYVTYIKPVVPVPILPAPSSISIATNVTLTGSQIFNSTLNVRKNPSASVSLTFPTAATLLSAVPPTRLVVGQKFYFTVNNLMPDNTVTLINPANSGITISNFTGPIPSQNSSTFEVTLNAITGLVAISLQNISTSFITYPIAISNIVPTPVASVLNNGANLTAAQILNSTLTVYSLYNITLTLCTAASLLSELNGTSKKAVGQKFFFTIANASSNVITVANPAQSGNTVTNFSGTIPGDNTCTFEITLNNVTTAAVTYNNISSAFTNYNTLSLNSISPVPKLLAIQSNNTTLTGIQMLNGVINCQPDPIFPQWSEYSLNVTWPTSAQIVSAVSANLKYVGQTFYVIINNLSTKQLSIINVSGGIILNNFTRGGTYNANGIGTIFIKPQTSLCLRLTLTNISSGSEIVTGRDMILDQTEPTNLSDYTYTPKSKVYYQVPNLNVLSDPNIVIMNSINNIKATDLDITKEVDITVTVEGLNPDQFGGLYYRDPEDESIFSGNTAQYIIGQKFNVTYNNFMLIKKVIVPLQLMRSYTNPLENGRTTLNGITGPVEIPPLNSVSFIITFVRDQFDITNNLPYHADWAFAPGSASTFNITNLNSTRNRVLDPLINNSEVFGLRTQKAAKVSLKNALTLENAGISEDKGLWDAVLKKYKNP